MFIPQRALDLEMFVARKTFSREVMICSRNCEKGQTARLAPPSLPAVP
jgi:hypothetical protein